MKALLASHNTNKLRELNDHISTLTLLSPPNILDVEENASTFEGNARLKALSYASHFAQNALADDSGLCVDALDGAPGVMSARYATLPPDIDHDPDTTAANNRKLLRALKDVPPHQRTAHFVCVLCLVIVQKDDIQKIVSIIQNSHNQNFNEQPDPCRLSFYDHEREIAIDETSRIERIEIFARGESYGSILQTLSGERGFGYDPLFYSPQVHTTFAHLSVEQKLRISHRGQAIAHLAQCLQHFV